MERGVVIADDDVGIRTLVVAVLEDAGFHVVATWGRTTLDVVQTHCPDVVLLDYQMPDMDGVEIAQRMRGDPTMADILIVAVSARGPTVCQAMGADGCLAKPFAIPELVAMVERPHHLTECESRKRVDLGR